MNETIYGQNVTVPSLKLPSDVLVMACIFLVTLTVTLVTNIVTIAVITSTPSLRTTTNMFIVSLSASDALYALFTMSIIALILLHSFYQFYYNPLIVQSVTYFAWGTLIHSSIGNLILVSLERWIYITKPFWYQRHITVKVVLISIGITWTSAVAVNLPYMFPKFASRNSSYFREWHGYIYPCLHTACCSLLLVIYTHIAVTTYQQLNKISKLKPQLQQQGADGAAVIVPVSTKRSRQSENWKAIKLLIIICGLYFVFASPYVYFYAYILLSPKIFFKMNRWTTPLLILLSIYHCSNFFVYSLRMRQFRRVLLRNFRKLVCCHGNRVSSTSIMDRTTSVFELQSRTQRWTENDGI